MVFLYSVAPYENLFWDELGISVVNCDLAHHGTSLNSCAIRWSCVNLFHGF